MSHTTLFFVLSVVSFGSPWYLENDMLEPKINFILCAIGNNFQFKTFFHPSLSGKCVFFKSKVR